MSGEGTVQGDAGSPEIWKEISDLSAGKTGQEQVDELAKSFKSLSPSERKVLVQVMDQMISTPGKGCKKAKKARAIQCFWDARPFFAFPYLEGRVYGMSWPLGIP